jgi:hypothetical protein
MKRQTVYLDMDGTIYPLYTQKNWLARLRSGDPSVFSADEQIVSEARLYEVFPTDRYDVRILSMTPAGATKEYAEQVKNVKDAWLDKFFPTLTKRIYKPYGHNKNLKNSANAILVDDSEVIRKNFKGLALDPVALW